MNTSRPNLSRGPVTMEVTAVGEDTRLSGLIDTVHTYKDIPTRLQGALENFTSIWVPVVLVGAVLAGYYNQTPIGRLFYYFGL